MNPPRDPPLPGGSSRHRSSRLDACSVDNSERGKKVDSTRSRSPAYSRCRAAHEAMCRPSPAGVQPSASSGRRTLADTPLGRSRSGGYDQDRVRRGVSASSWFRPVPNAATGRCWAETGNGAPGHMALPRANARRNALHPWPHSGASVTACGLPAGPSRPGSLLTAAGPASRVPGREIRRKADCAHRGEWPWAVGVEPPA
jgi:hypothetical protein